MYIKGIPDYNRNGESIETGLYIGQVIRDGELRPTKSGKSFGKSSVRAFNCKDGTAKFLEIKSFDDAISRIIANLRKGDRILVSGTIKTDEYNGKENHSMFVEFLITMDIPTSTMAENRAALNQRMDSAGFAEAPEEDAELPF